MTMASISAQKLSIGYRDKVIVHDICFSLGPGDFALLVGANGAGKSTFLRTLSGVQPAITGRIEVDGKPLSSYARRMLARQMSVVFPGRQGGGALTVQEAVEVGRHPYTGLFGRLSKNDNRVVEQAIEAVGLSDKASRYLATLSDGEYQKAAIARALAQEADILIFDEPTAFLDVAGRFDCIRLLRKLADAGRTVILSTHDIAQALGMTDVLMVIDKTSQGMSCGPKDTLVVDGVLDKAFAGSGLVFNALKGDFEYSH